MNDILVYIGALVAIVWGAAHIMPVRQVVAGFGAISGDNRKILTMAWIGEGLGILFTGILVLLVTGSGAMNSPVFAIVTLSSAVMLLVMAGVSALTGARTPVLPMKVCPLVKTGAALLLVAGTMF